MTLPPAVNNLVTHGPIQAVVLPDGHVLLLVQFEDNNLSTGSDGVVFATRPIDSGEIDQIHAWWARRVPNGSPVWHVDLKRRVTPSLYTANVDEVSP